MKGVVFGRLIEVAKSAVPLGKDKRLGTLVLSVGIHETEFEVVRPRHLTDALNLVGSHILVWYELLKYSPDKLGVTRLQLYEPGIDKTLPKHG